MNNDTSNLVNDLLSILQPDTAESVEKKETGPKVPQKAKKESQLNNKVVKAAAPKTPTKLVSENTFLAEIDETMKSVQFAKVVIRKDLYEVFMSIKRAKQVKSVSTLLDHALEDYIKRNSQSIKELLSESNKKSIL
jgi:hypothetical protein